jgi:putative sulfotransferase
MTEATIGVAIITRDDLAQLKGLLEQLAGFDQVVVVDTGSRDGTVEYVRGLGPPFECHQFKWRPRPAGYGPDDWGFSAARNESFAHLKTTYALWLDSDDIVAAVIDGSPVTASAESIASAFRSLAANSPDTDAWLVDYVYTSDEFGNPNSVITKERLLRLDVGWRWRHPIHELVFSEKDPQDIVAVRVSDLVVVHRPHDVEKSARRNAPMLRAWNRQLERAGASDADLSRAHFLVGRSLRAQGQYVKAAQWMLAQFLAKHPEMPPDDKWEGWMEVAKDLLLAGDRDGARHAALEAIGLCPRFGDAYIVLADMKLAAGERPGDILKLIEIAESCAGESYGPHEHSPLLTSFNGALIASQCQLRLGRDRDALALADRALAMRPGDERAKRAWQVAADAASANIDQPRISEAAPTAIPIAAKGTSSQDPVFVVSSGRCGSTLVSNMLRLHPDILSLSEFLIMLMPGAFLGGRSPITGAQFWSLLSTPRKRMTLMQRHGIVFDEVLYRPGPGRRFSLETGVPPILLTALPHLSDEPEALYDEIQEFSMAQGTYGVGRHYIRLFDWLTERLGHKVWVERSGSSLVHLEEYMANFPGARFVHLYRDGRECAISMGRHSAFRLSMITGELQRAIGVDPFNTDEPPHAEAPPGFEMFMPDTFDRDAFWKYDVSLEKLGAGWSTQESHALGLMAQLPANRVFQLRYENLVAHPREELTRLIRFVGLPEPGANYLDRAAAIVRIKPPAWPQLPASQRESLNEACKLGMGLLYGSRVLEPSLEPV